jgi:hypothetical protein
MRSRSHAIGFSMDEMKNCNFVEVTFHFGRSFK